MLTLPSRVIRPLWNQRAGTGDRPDISGQIVTGQGDAGNSGFPGGCGLTREKKAKADANSGDSAGGILLGEDLCEDCPPRGYPTDETRMTQLRALDQRPLAIELFAGLHGWGEGAVEAGFRVVGFDLFDMCRIFNRPRPKGIEIVLQDVLTLHGSQFRDAALIVASPPCQNYSYLAMPWSRSKDPNNSKAAKALRLKWETEGPDNRLFDACFRIQREAIEATAKRCCGGPDCLPSPDCPRCHGRGYTERYIPLIVENVRGAQPWVGRSAWNYGSFHLWGDVPALMPINLKRGRKVAGFRFDGSGGSFQTASVNATALPHFCRCGHDELAHSAMRLKCFQCACENFNPEGDGIKQLHSRGDNQTCGKHRMGLGDGVKVPGQVHGTEYAFTRTGANGQTVLGTRSPQENAEGTKIGGDWLSDPNSTCRKHGSRSNARKMASAMIAKIPLELARHIAAVYKPRHGVAA